MGLEQNCRFRTFTSVSYVHSGNFYYGILLRTLNREAEIYSENASIHNIPIDELKQVSPEEIPENLNRRKALRELHSTINSKIDEYQKEISELRRFKQLVQS
jgi:hypothetical protein